LLLFEKLQGLNCQILPFNFPSVNLEKGWVKYLNEFSCQTRDPTNDIPLDRLED